MRKNKITVLLKQCYASIFEVYHDPLQGFNPAVETWNGAFCSRQFFSQENE